MAWCALCQRDGGRRSRPLCKHVRKATTKPERRTCRCSGVSYPHRWGSNCGPFGCCVRHPSHSEKMYAILNTPVRRAR